MRTRMIHSQPHGVGRLDLTRNKRSLPGFSLEPTRTHNAFDRPVSRGDRRSLPAMKNSPSVSRRRFLSTTAIGAAAASLGRVDAATTAASPAVAAKKPMLMRAGHQHDHSETTLRALAAFGVKNICSGHL